ncbi:TolC family outer membrane protein [Comamonas sp. CMM02]|jgi:adhesin transport system outer membrane protein|nr:MULTISPECIES: TolC family outer membrane protein [unclassified Comamonas]MBD9403623.1 TolC family outer membrane protein [Comamonas sp. CMM02]
MKMRNLSKVMTTLGITSFAVSAFAQQAAPAMAPQAAPTTAPQAVPAVAAQAMAPVGLNQVVERAITSHPEINARYQDFVSTLEDQNIARAGWRPSITAQAWTGREWRSNIENAPSYDWNRPGWNVELRQLIFDGGATSNRIRQFGFEKLSKYYDLHATSNNLANEAVAAYLDVQRYRSMQALAQENFSMHAATLGQLRERQESGVGRGVDMEQASGRLSLAQTNLMTESNNLNDVTQRFRRVVGEYPAAQLPAVPEVTGGLPVIGQTQNFEESLRVNPAILSKQALVQAAQAGEKVAKAAGYAPTLDVRASTGRDREQPGALYRDVQSSRVQLMLTYPIYRGGADSARIRQTAAQGYAAQDVRDYTCRNVQQELSVAWNNIVRLRQQLPFLREHELSTSKVRVAYMQQFRIGQRSLLDLLDTENELFDARRAMINADYDLKKAEYYWLALSNQVLPNLGLVQPHRDAEPEEQQALVLPDEPLRACMDTLPDTSNLTPVALKQMPK